MTDKKVQERIERLTKIATLYEDILEALNPLVDKWFNYFNDDKTQMNAAAFATLSNLQRDFRRIAQENRQDVALYDELRNARVRTGGVEACAGESEGLS